MVNFKQNESVNTLMTLIINCEFQFQTQHFHPLMHTPSSVMQVEQQPMIEVKS